jgi:hypothetical protein
MAKDKTDREQALISDIQTKLKSGKPSEAYLETDERVLARITDGIYRQPSSALRELIANAYDADAENVYIQTDCPRFQQIRVRDDGHGLSVKALSNLIHHIGGSPKRTPDGVELGVVDKKDNALSPKGRRLIGKIGIGLFSVAQLTRHFQIITKEAGKDYRLVAEVELLTYREDAPHPQDSGKGETRTGKVKIISVPAENKDEHGTEIILLNLKDQTRHLLQSQDMWHRVHSDETFEGDTPIEAPKYHIGRFVNSKLNEIDDKAELPWLPDDEPKVRFGKLVQALIDEVQEGASRPRLDTLLDNYLRTLWVLSLSAPLDYIEKHPFDLTGSDELYFYRLSNDRKGQPKQLDLKPKEQLRDRLNLKTPERGKAPPFNVFVDEVQLFRPIRFRDLPTTSHTIKKPLLFAGSFRPDLSKYPEDIRGGSLDFEAYFLWTPKVVPSENTGLLIRISDASGTLFDETFIKYQVSEQTRLRQITAEVFVREGLDPALNIDRESFNFAHPHYQILMKWVHSALRQLANAHKDLASTIRDKARKGEAKEKKKKLKKTVADEIKKAAPKRDEDDVPEVVFTTDTKEAAEARKKGDLAFDSAIVFAPLPEPARVTDGKTTQRELYEERIRGVAQILEAYGLLDKLPYQKQQELLRAILAIFVEQVN